MTLLARFPGLQGLLSGLGCLVCRGGSGVTLTKNGRIACKGIAVPGPGTDLEFSSGRGPKPLKIKMAELPARGSSFARDLHLEELYEKAKNQTNVIVHIWHSVWTMDMTGAEGPQGACL